MIEESQTPKESSNEVLLFFLFFLRYLAVNLLIGENLVTVLM